MRRSLVSLGVVLSLVAGLIVGLPQATAAAVPPHGAETSVPVTPIAAQSSSSAGVTGVSKAERVVLPSAASVRVAASGTMVGVAGLPVAVSGAIAPGEDVLSDGLARAGVVPGGLSAVQVSTADPAVAQKAGVRGVLLSLSRSDGSAGAAALRLRVGYAAWAQLFGGDYGNRLRLVSMPSCAVTTPGIHTVIRRNEVRFDFDFLQSARGGAAGG